MKKFIVLILLANFSSVFAQSYTPFPTSNATWVNYVYDFGGWGPPAPPYTDYLVAIDNYCASGQDTTIGLNQYTKLNYCNGNYKGAFRDTGGVVFFIPKDSLSEKMWYNFNVNVGDTIVFPDFGWSWYNSIYVSEIDSILIAGNYRTVISFLDVPDVWIEGMGCSAGLFAHPAYNDNISGGMANMECFSHNDTSYVPDGTSTFFNAGASCSLNYLSSEPIHQTNNVDVYPNPTTGLLILQLGEAGGIIELQILNSLGQTVPASFTVFNNQVQLDLSGLSNGMYFLQVEVGDIMHTKRIVKE